MIFYAIFSTLEKLKIISWWPSWILEAILDLTAILDFAAILGFGGHIGFNIHCIFMPHLCIKYYTHVYGYGQLFEINNN